MGSKAKKPRAMRSKKSGVKSQIRIDANNKILSKLVKEAK